MRLSVILVSEGLSPAGAAEALAALPRMLRPGDQLILTDCGSDHDLTAALNELAEPEVLPDGAELTLLHFGMTPPAGRWAQANAAMAEANRDALLFLFAGQIPDPRALAGAREELAASRADLLLAGGPRPEADRQAWLAQVPALRPAPALIRHDWLLGRNPRLADAGSEPDQIRHWQLCVAAGRIGWIAEPLISSPPPATPFSSASLPALHASLAAMDRGLEKPALCWLVGQLAHVGPGLPADDRWSVAAQLARQLSACPESLWRAAMAQIAPSRATAIAAALRQGAVLHTVSLWTQEAAEARMASVESGLARLEHEVAGLRSDLDSLHRIAEYDALAAGWREAEPGDVSGDVS